MRASNKKAKHFVYCILNPQTNLLKIGFSAEPERRLHELELKTGCELELVGTIECDDWIHAQDKERHFHILFKGLRRLGEWFQNVWYLRVYFETGCTPEEVSDAQQWAHEEAYISILRKYGVLEEVPSEP